MFNDRRKKKKRYTNPNLRTKIQTMEPMIMKKRDTQIKWYMRNEKMDSRVSGRDRKRPITNDNAPKWKLHRYDDHRNLLDRTKHSLFAILDLASGASDDWTTERENLKREDHDRLTPMNDQLKKNRTIWGEHRSR